MNLILLFPADFIDEHKVVLLGVRMEHIRAVLRAGKGDSLRVGLLNGLLGTGIISAITDKGVELIITLKEVSPVPLPITLLLAMPRPKCFRRIIQCATTMGVKRIALFGAYRVEKSYWKSPWLEDQELQRQLVLGLEQARDTEMPQVTMHPFFKPFVEDEVSALAAGSRCLVAHPSERSDCPSNISEPMTLAIGPEGGFTDYELGLLTERGFECITLGKRILRTEQAVPAFLGRLMRA
ncbi:MAG: 16S rRNA (uracil(1498)-N(3))-methyltransferase [bacterium]|jgi:16S rRNA (uracil1498-N3)-methyltransferase